MKRVIALLALLPTPALAHGIHAPVSDPLHGLAHLAPVALPVALLILAALVWRMRQ